MISGAVIPLFNSSLYVHELFISLINQTKQLNQIVFIDDCSQDNTIHLTKNLINKYNSLLTEIIFIENKNNLGVSNSLNIGISELSSDLIFFSGHDDIWKENRVEISHKHLSDGNDFIHSYYNTFGSHISLATPTLSPTDLAIGMINGNKIGAITVALNMKNISKKNIYFNSRYNGAEDYDLWTDLIINGHKPFCIPEVLMDYRISENQMSRKFDYFNTPLLNNIQIKYFTNLFPTSMLSYYGLIKNLSQIPTNKLHLINTDSNIKDQLKIVLNILERENVKSWILEIYQDLIIRIKLILN